MKNTNKAKMHLGFSEAVALDENGKRGYYFHADEDFREDHNWKAKSTHSSKRDTATIKRIPSS